MFDEHSAEVRAARAPFEELLAQHNARVAAIGEEFAGGLSASDKASAERDKEQSQQLAAILEQEKQQQNGTAEQQPPNEWTAPREKDTTISFGEFDDEEHRDPKSTWSAPTPPMGLPPLPPIPDPIPAPEPAPRAAALEPMMRFGEFEDEDAPPPQSPPRTPPPPPPPPPPRPGRRRRLQDEDDDMSGQTWLS
jgi:hypothetical protein